MLEMENIDDRKQKLKFLDFLYTFDKHLKILNPDHNFEIKKEFFLSDSKVKENITSIFELEFSNDENEFPTQRICLELDQEISIPEYLEITEQAGLTYENFSVGKFFKTLDEHHKLDGKLKMHPFRYDALEKFESVAFSGKRYSDIKSQKKNENLDNFVKKVLKIK
jgi:hypothetical protein